MIVVTRKPEYDLEMRPVKAVISIFNSIGNRRKYFLSENNPLEHDIPTFARTYRLAHGHSPSAPRLFSKNL